MLNILTSVSYSDSQPPIRPEKLLKFGQNCFPLYSQYTISLFCLCTNPADEKTYALLKWMPNHSYTFYKCAHADYLFSSCDTMLLSEKMSAENTLRNFLCSVYEVILLYTHV